MNTLEINREQWNGFFQTFSKQHEGWLVTLEVFDPEIGAQEEVHELPLEGIATDVVDDETERITISVGRTREDHLTHTITNPTHVWLEQTPVGANAAVEFESADGAKTLLRFRSPMPSELIDGIVPM